MRTGMRSKKYLLALYALISALVSACSAGKYLPKNESLYTGATVTVIPDSGTMKNSKKKAMQAELLALVRPKPNTRHFGLFRDKLWFYNIAGTPKGKGLRYFLKTTMGEPPVLFSSVSPKRNVEILKNHLENCGYFLPEVYSKVRTLKGRKTKVDYFAKVGRPYLIRKIIFPGKDSSINKLIYKTRVESYIRPGMQYNLDSLKNERERINTALKEEGLYYFTPDDIIFKADTTAGDHEVDIYVQVKRRLSVKATRIYTLNNIYVYSNHTLFQDSFKKKPDTILVQGYYYIGSRKIYRPNIIVSSIFLQKDSVYNYTDYDITLNRLMRLGIYKFVNIKFKDLDTTNKTGRLDTYIYLSPLPRKSLRFEFKLVSKSDNFAGPLVNFSFKNRNLFRGAELLTFNANASIEEQISGIGKGQTSTTLGGDITLDIPRFITPFFTIDPANKFVPKTELKLGFQKLSEINYYNENTFGFSAGYKWNQSETVEHVFNPIVINFLKLGQTSGQFDSILNHNITLKRSFATQFIIGSYYSYTYNTQGLSDRKFDWYFNGTADVSGNLLGLVQSAITNHEPSPDAPNKIFGEPYSQYVLGTLDFRHYWNVLGKEKRLVTRLFAGAGIPYGNSSTLPYIKEFFAGGNNSIRAFPSRILGPGSYRLSPDQLSSVFIDQVGDIKLEGNIEYRFPIAGVIKGALFTDAGNIWLVNEDTARPGGKFNVNTFYKQIAVGSGFGIRVDASYFVLRFDLAFPLRKPYTDANGNYWVIDKISPFNGVWIKNNLVLNIGIGYPF